MKQIPDCRKGGRNLVEYVREVLDYKTKHEAADEIEDSYAPIVLELLLGLLVELRLLRKDSFLITALLAGQVLLTLAIGLLSLFIG